MIPRGDSLVIVVADGAGGMRGGALASESVVTCLEGALDGDLRDWNRALLALDQRLARAMGGESTVVALRVSPHGIEGTSVGDSEAWLVGPDDVDVLTHAQSAQSRRRIGSGRADPIVFHRQAARGILVVGSDGLFARVTPAAMIATTRHRSPKDAADALLALARLPSGQFADDVSVVVVAI